MTSQTRAVRPPFYRLSTVVPLSKDEVLAPFEGAMRAPCSMSDAVWACTDGSEIKFLPSEDPSKFYVEFRIRFHPESAKKSVSLGILSQVLALCQEHGGLVKVRSGSVLPATGGILSDVLHSEAWRLTSHQMEHPRDIKAR